MKQSTKTRQRKQRQAAAIRAFKNSHPEIPVPKWATPRNLTEQSKRLLVEAYKAGRLGGRS